MSDSNRPDDPEAIPLDLTSLTSTTGATDADATRNESADNDLAGEDQALMNQIRSLMKAADPAPESLNAAARGLLRWRDPDSALAELVADSRQLAGAVRGDTDVMLNFEADGLQIVVQLTPTGSDQHRLIGQVEPARSGIIRVRRLDGTFETAVDDMGRFDVDRIGSGPFSLTWNPDSGHAAVDTPWQVV